MTRIFFQLHNTLGPIRRFVSKPAGSLNTGPSKKLLVMNISGLLLYRVHLSKTDKIPKSRRPDGSFGNSLVYKRPFSGEFFKFCLERFQVGIWSSAKGRNVDDAIDYACGTSKTKLLFTWDQGRCTYTRYYFGENNLKPILFKDLHQVWNRINEGGPYSASNTLLIDDQPYTAFLNPPNTAIFPEPYNPEDEADKALDPKGELCSYLQGLADANDVQAYVKEHPFGQPSITSSHPDWHFYSEVRSSLGK